MRKIKISNLSLTLYRVMNAIFILGCIILCGTSYVGIENPKFGHILVAILVVVVVYSGSAIKGKFKWAYYAFFIATLIAFVLVFARKKTGNFIIGYFYWIFGSDRWNYDWYKLYTYIQAGILAVLSCVVLTVLEKIPFMKVIFTAVVTALLIFWMVIKRNVLHSGMMFYLGLLIVTIVEFLEKRWNKNRQKNIKNYCAWLMPVIVAIILCMSVIPDFEKPYDWRYAKKFCYSVSENFNKVYFRLFKQKTETYGNVKVGFSSNGTIGGNLEDEKNKVLFLEWKSKNVSSIYLSGITFDSFDGKEWRKTVFEDNNDRIYDTLETLYAVKRYDNSYSTDYLHKNVMTVKYEDISTEYLFAPLKCFSFASEDENINLSGADIMFDKIKGYGNSYEIMYFQPNLDNDEFYTMTEERKDQDDDLFEISKRIINADSSISLSDLENHEKWVHENYLESVELSERCLDWLDKITADKETDIEKLRSIEQALSAFSYTLSPGELPDYIESAGDFLDYFIFEGKEGYCSYFATAFVLLARACDVPARMVRGFCVPLGNAQSVYVESGMAHAWPEVYIDGYGWLPFEPTPGYSDNRYEPWEMTDKEAQKAEHIINNPQEIPDYSDIKDDTEIKKDTVVEKKKKEWETIRIVLSVIFTGLGIVVVFIFGENIWFKIRYKKMSISEKFAREVSKNIFILKLFGIARDDYETLEELGIKVKNNGNHEGMEHLSFISLYENYLYGNLKIGNGEYETVMNDQKVLYAIMKKQTLRKRMKNHVRLYFFYHTDRKNAIR